ncbi:MAG: nucleoside permease [Planctomycetia bacterium]
MNNDIRIRLSIMMFLQYFIWGAWFVTLASFASALKFSGDEIGWVYATVPLGGILAPFLVGLVADRFFAAERILGVLHLLGAVVLYQASQQTTFAGMFPILIVYAVCYMPTLALTNSLSFRQMTNPAAEFPGIRVLGTIGWIAAGVVVGLVAKEIAGGSIEPTKYPMQIAAVCSAALGVFSFFLPHTPPANRGVAVRFADVLGLEALALMKETSFLVFVLGSFLVCIPLQFYYALTNLFLNETSFPNPAFSMTFGQMSEILFMLVMPIFFVRLGVKWMLVVGMVAWVVRYLCFASLNVPLVYVGIILHGICYDFFFVTGQIYVDRKAPSHLRAAAQGFIAMVTLGVGQFIGSVLAGRVLAAYTGADGAHDWAKFWVVPAVFAGVVLMIFAVFFNEKEAPAPVADAELADAEAQPTV